MKKITVRQMLLLVISTVFSPAVRLFSSFYSASTNQSAWIAPLIAGVITLAFVFVLNGIMKSGRSFFSQAEFSFGKRGAKAVGAVYLIWGTLLTALQMRYYSQRITTTIYTDIGLDPFVIVMAVLCIFALNKGIETFARMNEMISALVLAVTVGIMLLLVREAKTDRLLPLDDGESVLRATACTAANFGYITFTLFFADKLTQKEKFLRKSIVTVSVISLLSLWLFFSVVATLGPAVIKKLEYPFFGVVKQITVGEFLQHIEALIVTLWIMSDFVIIAFIGSAMTELAGFLFNTEKVKQLHLPYYVICTVLVPFLGRNDGDLKLLSEKIFVPANLILLFFVPCVMLFFGKIKESFLRKKSLVKTEK